MSHTIDKVKHALHLDKDKSAVSTGATTGHTTHTGTAGVGNNSSTAGHTTHTGTAGYGNTSSNAGPHGSNLANKLDPTVDSDRDGSSNLGAHSHNATTGGAYGGTHGTHTGTHGGIGNNTSTAGPHGSNVANKLDPTVDSDRDGSRNLGAHSHNTATGGTYGGTHGTHTGTHTGTHGGISNSTNAGPHDSNLGNKLDPRVDSDLDSTGNRHGASTRGGVFGTSGSHATPGSGTAQNTAGPHNSDLLNKADPRVDADLDGSKTYGGNATHR